MRKTRKRKRRRKTTIGARLIVLLLLLALSPILPAGLLGAGDKPSESAVVAGTVFREPGFALPGAEVTLTVKTVPEGEGAQAPEEGFRCAGEFAFYVPAPEGSVSCHREGPRPRPTREGC